MRNQAKQLLLASTMLAGLALGVGTAEAAPICPFTGLDTTGTGCGAIVTINPGGSLSVALTGLPAYDGIEDTSVGVINNSGGPVSSFVLTQAGTGTPIFELDGDGIDNFGGNGVVGNLTDASSATERGSCTTTSPFTGCYGGPNAFFSGVNAGLTSGTVNFITAIPNGGTDFFSLEGPPTALAPPSVPEPASLAVLGSSLMGFAFAARRRRNAK